MPHSGIFGSALVCQLAEAYRRLLRPSSPPDAKASTMCPSILDPPVFASLRASPRAWTQRLPPSLFTLSKRSCWLPDLPPHRDLVRSRRTLKNRQQLSSSPSQLWTQPKLLSTRARVALIVAHRPFWLLKGGDPAAGSPTATLLRLHPNHRPDRWRLPPLRVEQTTLGPANFRGVTGGVYKARERIHRGILIRDY